MASDGILVSKVLVSKCCKNLEYAAGDMFEAVPSADALLLKWILHDWSDEDCIKILQQCKQAITRNGKHKVGKVIIIDIVRENKNRDEVSTETQLFFDMEMMVTVNGMERNEKEWAKLFLMLVFSITRYTSARHKSSH
ncbi:6a-hydroxymaackiain methyltransferase family protein [Salix suchowensis]|nr:6a-hydroxymaackiain methyltransferase family protein [Salix suchowensis]